ncbi:HAMP domain-containing histidine kinase [Sulfurimonas lithotrophica]|uniref:histidine kinase n=1 Tax=Sulfurimonas lithotrophica TaxID=2590022 RepID=A0A5P8NZC1_9BACT|nr:HAMP domain-containing sensor histidine kinase [Sulfurimonas lithotrophica]QFR48771.1 HAMP domain-containing histidine kinase [Sulfurimonas lithotrophica]
MFHNLRLNIFIYYFFTTLGFLFVLYYFLEVLEFGDVYLLLAILATLAIFSGVFISKLAIEPFQEHLNNIEHLSKETLHELNLPIATIKTNTQMLSKNMNNEKDLKRISRILSASNMLEQRYNELDYMIKTHTTKEINEDFFLDELVKERIDFLQGIYPNKTFKLKLERVNIFNDKIGLGKVIDNIIDNGIKYSKNSDIIDIYLKNKYLTIQDYGQGMDESELLKVFDKYYQGDTGAKGFGIGLSLVKRFCDKQNIKLSIDSKPNYGTKITLMFK